MISIVTFKMIIGYLQLINGDLNGPDLSGDFSWYGSWWLHDDGVRFLLWVNGDWVVRFYKVTWWWLNSDFYSHLDNGDPSFMVIEDHSIVGLSIKLWFNGEFDWWFNGVILMVIQMVINGDIMVISIVIFHGPYGSKHCLS